ncbi:MAG: hypothetical protein ILA23_08750 [Bacteroidales bacterium]|nr:hypothetical protein [Bacteroidales bacterium]
MKPKTKDLLQRYAVASLGLIFVAVGVALSLKSNLGTAPISCPPAVMNLQWSFLSVGTLTWMMHIVLILIQAAILRRRFKVSYLMQIPAAFVFGYLCDAAIWAFDWLQVDSYETQMFLCILTILVTAIGVRLEVIGNAWMLAGEMTTVVLSDVTQTRFSTVKVLFDIFCVILSAAFAWFAFGYLTGNGNSVVIREGTLILAICTGLCMKLTDPVVDKVFRRFLERQR